MAGPLVIWSARAPPSECLALATARAWEVLNTDRSRGDGGCAAGPAPAPAHSGAVWVCALKSAGAAAAARRPLVELHTEAGSVEVEIRR